MSFIKNLDLRALCIKNFSAFIVQNNSISSRNLFVKIAKNHKETQIIQYLTKNLFSKDNVHNAHIKTKLMQSNVKCANMCFNRDWIKKILDPK